MSAVTDAAALCLVFAGIVVGLAAWLRFKRPVVALRAMLECFTAAGLLRLSTEMSWSAVAGVAAVIAVRRLAAGRLTADLLARRKTARPSG
ncbi:hypothetical protein ACQI4F_00285 [Mycolicibacterium vaccae]|uniref:hypothetical protein n=1 Tax=Mycolicibacterium vaccae TaxID=1810 RepID=UPI003CEC15D0